LNCKILDLADRPACDYRTGVGVRLRSWTVSRWRWGAVIVSVAVLCFLPAAVAAVPVNVPAVSATQLRAKILASRDLSFAGYAESNADFGLPAFSAFSGTIALLDGVTRMRVWQASTDHWRVDTLTDTGEDDTYQDGDTATFDWDSGEQLLTEITGKQTVRLPRASDLTPPALSASIIDDVGPGARLNSLPTRRIAGEGAAGISITPASADSTIGRVDIWANPSSGLPLLVQVFARGAGTPALTSQFLDVSLWKPVASVLKPRRGPGTGFTATTPGDFSSVLKNLGFVVLPTSLDGLKREPTPAGLPQFGGPGRHPGRGGFPGIQGEFAQLGVYGDGLATFAVLAFRPGTAGNLMSGALSNGADKLTFSDGGTGAVASAPLLNLVLIQPTGSRETLMLIGLVSRGTLEQAAQALAAGQPVFTRPFAPAPDKKKQAK
jgi:hypothetical protein